MEIETIHERSGKETRELIFNEEKCNVCGLCEKICPVNAIEVSPPGAVVREENISKLILDEDKCVLCGMCSSICPYDALDLQIDKKIYQRYS